MIKGIYTHPPMQTKVVWAGLYGGHYDIIVFFKEKPIPSIEEHNYIDGEWYNCSDNQDLIIGDMCLIDFYKCFPTVDLRDYTQQREDTTTLGGRPIEIEITEVFQMEITTCFNERGDMEQFKFNNDW